MTRCARRRDENGDSMIGIAIAICAVLAFCIVAWIVGKRGGDGALW